MKREKIVITGLGVLAPNGNSVQDFWDSLVNGKSGIDAITYFDSSNHRVKIAGELKDFRPEDKIDPKELRKLDPFSTYALIATDEAVTMAGLNPEDLDLDRVGVTIGTGVGGIQTLEEQHSNIENKGARRVSPQFVPKMISNIAGGHLSIKWGFRGPNQTVTSACASATDAIGMAMRLILAGDADVMIAGGSEAAITELTVAGFSSAKALSNRNEDPKTASRPWDIDRDGFVIGEGAGVMVLEEYEHAKKRNAKIYCELSGYGMSADAYHITAPSIDGPKRSMLNAIKNAGLNTDEINFINAHGTSTPVGDLNETNAIKDVFKSHSKEMIVNSTKSMTGHLLGGAGGIESVFTVLSIKNQISPPTINIFNQDPACDLDFCANEARDLKIDAALKNNFGFGGTNGSLVFTKI